MIRFTCTKCGKRLKSNPGTSGKHAKCSRCQTSVLVPDDGTGPAPMDDVGVEVVDEHDEAIVEEVEEEKKLSPKEEAERKEKRLQAKQRKKEKAAQNRTIGIMLMAFALFLGGFVGLIETFKFSTRTVINGTVTFDGKPVADGYITFTPVDPKGMVTSAKIVNGKYELTSPFIGESVVLITAVGNSQFAKGRGDPKEGDNSASGPADLFGPDAIGNNKTVNVKKGKYALDFDLKPAPPPPPKDKAKDNEPPPRGGTSK